MMRQSTKGGAVAEFDVTVLGERFADAVRYASALHRDQARKQTRIPYLSHLLAAASLVLEQGGDEDEAIAALLHDALEDQWERTSEEQIRDRFGDKVARIVVACSDSTGGRKQDWKPRKRAHLDHLATQTPEVLRVSIADKLHNARSIVADLRVAGDVIWDRFTAGPQQQAWYYTALADIFRQHLESPLVTEFQVVVAELVEGARRASP